MTSITYLLSSRRNLKNHDWQKHAVTSLNQLMVKKSKLQRNSLSALDRLLIFSTTSKPVMTRGQPVRQKMSTRTHTHYFTATGKQNKLVSMGDIFLSLAHPAEHQSPLGLRDAVSPHTVSGGEKKEPDREETLACTKYNNKQIKHLIDKGWGYILHYKLKFVIASEVRHCLNSLTSLGRSGGK